MGIFKTYDVRGVYPTQLDERAFYEIGRRCGVFKIKKIAVAKDARLSSPTLSKSLIDGLLDAGIDVIDIGITTSPMLSHMCAKNKIFGAMITASHNPKEYNGIKFVNKKAIQVSYDDGLCKLEQAMSKKALKKATKRGKLVHRRILNEYADYIEKKFRAGLKPNKKLKIVFDSSNGVGSLPLFMLNRLNVDPIFINETLDGNFPNHPCDQTKKENLAQLQTEVKKKKADLGVMFDGDADRCAFVDEKGDIVRLDLAFLLLALNAIDSYSMQKGKRKPKPKVLYDLRFTKSMKEEVQRKKSISVMMRVGNPFYKKYMAKDKSAIIAGELSGHIMYQDNFGIDDPFYASLKMILLLSKSKEPMSHMIKKYDKYYSSGEINYHLESKEAQDAAIQKIKDAYKKERKLMIDGITILENGWWMNLRASNTEPVLRLIIEGANKNIVDSQRSAVEFIIGKSKG